MTELLFDGPGGNKEIQANVHDMGTPLDELLAFPMDTNTSGQPRPVRMNLETWNKLAPADQKAWDYATDNGKRAILDYARPRGQPPNQQNQNQRRANNHDTIFEDGGQKSPPEPSNKLVEVSTCGTKKSQVPKVQASTHEAKKPTKPPEPPKAKKEGTPTLLAMVLRAWFKNWLGLIWINRLSPRIGVMRPIYPMSSSIMPPMMCAISFRPAKSYKKCWIAKSGQI